MLGNMKVAKNLVCRFNPNPNGKLIRTFFSNSLDVAPSAPVAPLRSLTPLLEADVPLFDSELISRKVMSDLPGGYSIRPLCRSDYGRGFMDVARMVGKTGYVEEDVWDLRCEWLGRNSETYFIVVVLDYDDIVVASGTLLFERKLYVIQDSTIAWLILMSRSTHSMGIVAHIQDIAVARTQKGKRMGLRVLEALVYAATEYGAYKVGIPSPIATQEYRDQIQALLSHSQFKCHWNAARMPVGFLLRHRSSFSAISDLVGDAEALLPNTFLFILPVP